MFSGSLARIFLTFAIALGAIYLFHLSRFQFFSRAQSVGSGLQKITISCLPGAESPESVNTVEQLEKLGCRHINLEDIEREITGGNVVKTIYRNDPNVNIRKEIYGKSWLAIKKNPLTGIGWGSIGKMLGTDERGANLNASNIFLEVWLGSGILGLLAFLALWIYVLLRNISNLIRAEIADERAFAVFAIVSWFGLTVANLFNSGIMLGLLWLFLAISLIETRAHANRN